MVQITENQNITDYGLLSKGVMTLLMSELQEVADNVVDKYEGYVDEVHNVESKSRDGFMSFTDGGVYVHVDIMPPYLIGSGDYPSYMENYIDQLEQEATEFADDDFGERTEENEDEYYEVYDSWFEDMDVSFYFQILYYDAENEGEGENRLYGSVDLVNEYGRSVSEESSKFLDKATTEIVINDMNDMNEVEKAVSRIIKVFDIV